MLTAYPQKVSYTVYVTLPENVSVLRFQQYIEDEIKANVGRLPPADPLFHLDRKSVIVTTTYIGEISRKKPKPKEGSKS